MVKDEVSLSFYLEWISLATIGPHKRSRRAEKTDMRACTWRDGPGTLCVCSFSDLDFQSNFTTLYSCSPHFLLRQHRKAPNPRSSGLCNPSPFASSNIFCFTSVNEVNRKLLSKCSVQERSFLLIWGLSASHLYLQYNLTCSAKAPSLFCLVLIYPHCPLCCTFCCHCYNSCAPLPCSLTESTPNVLSSGIGE